MLGFNMPEPRSPIDRPVGQGTEQRRLEHERMLDRITHQAEGVAGLISWYDQTRSEVDPQKTLTALDAAVTAALDRVGPEAQTNFQLLADHRQRQTAHNQLVQDETKATDVSIDDELDFQTDLFSDEAIALYRESLELLPLASDPNVLYVQLVLAFQEQMHAKVTEVARLRNNPVALRTALQRALTMEKIAIQAKDVKKVIIEATGIQVLLIPDKYQAATAQSRHKDPSGIYLPISIFSLISKQPNPEQKLLAAIFGTPVDHIERHEAVHNLIDDTGFANYAVPQTQFTDLLNQYLRLKNRAHTPIEFVNKNKASLLNPAVYLRSLHNEFLAQLGPIRLEEQVRTDQYWSTAEADCRDCVTAITEAAKQCVTTDPTLSAELGRLASRLQEQFKQLKSAMVEALTVAKTSPDPATVNFAVALAVVLQPNQYRHIGTVLQRKLQHHTESV